MQVHMTSGDNARAAAYMGELAGIDTRNVSAEVRRAETYLSLPPITTP